MPGFFPVQNLETLNPHCKFFTVYARTHPHTSTWIWSAFYFVAVCVLYWWMQSFVSVCEVSGLCVCVYEFRISPLLKSVKCLLLNSSTSSTSSPASYLSGGRRPFAIFHNGLTIYNDFLLYPFKVMPRSLFLSPPPPTMPACSLNTTHQKHLFFCNPILFLLNRKSSWYDWCHWY